MRQQHRHDDPIAALAARLDAQKRRRHLLLLGDDRAGRTPQQHMHHVLGMRRCAHLGVGASRWRALLVRDDSAPAKVALRRGHLHEAACLQEREGIARVPLHLAAVLVELLERLLHGIVGADRLLVRNFNSIALSLSIGQLLLECGHRRGILELEKAAREHRFRRHAFHAHEVEYHIVAKMEGAVQPVGLALDHGLGRGRVELLVEHHNHNTAIIESTTACAPTHLDKLARGQVAELVAVPLLHGGEHDGAGGHVETDTKRLGRKEHLEQALLEQDLNDLLENRQQAAMMDADPAAQQWENVLDLWQCTVLGAQRVDGVGEHGLHHIALLVRVELQLAHLQRKRLALPLAESKDNHGVVTLDHDHLDDLVNVRGAGRAALFRLALAPATRVRAARVFARGARKRTHGLLEVVLAEYALLVDDEVDALPPLGKKIVLQWRGAEIGVHDVAGLRMDVGNPLGKLHRIRDGRREEHIVHLARQQDDRLFPHDTALLVAHVVNLIKDDPRDLAHDLRAAVQH